ncbi:Ppx/GppA family phosphatase [Hyphomonas sp. UBA4494]|uniref:Ppx/GppA family phosphatase n=1 Tax=Hyphomonas sp. UBA4494 TaxID=1946631 RepID=UPI0025BC406B|nr:Ppx/GppA family phosphatase [Hyphomonas sp. UBA4494]
MAASSVARSAVVDIGSNSVRMVAFDRHDRSLAPVFNEKAMSGLGRNLLATSRLDPAGWASALAILARFRMVAASMGVDRIRAVATAAVRDAFDGEEFVRVAEAALGAPVEVLAGSEEARLSGVGVLCGIPGAEGMIGDLGGSSLEFKQIGGKAADGESLMLGPLSLVEGDIDLKALRRAIRAELKASDVLAKSTGRFYAVGGAWRTVAKLNMQIEDYSLKVLQGYQMSKSQVDKVAKLCFDSVTSSTARAMLENVDKRRAKHLPVAAILLQEILGNSRLEGVTISSAGLREGVLRDALGAPLHDPLMDGAIAFARLDKNQILFGEALHDFIAPALAPEPDLFGSPAADIRIEKAACMMADSAGRFHPDHRSIMAYDQALRAPYVGVSHGERALIAYAIGCRYQKDFKRPDEYVALTTPEQDERARQIGSAMRLGAVFSGRSGPILQRARLVRTHDTLQLKVSKADEAMVSDTVERRLSQTASQLRLKSDVIIS